MEDLKWEIPKTSKHPERMIRPDARITPAKVLAAVLAVFTDEEEVTKAVITAAGRGVVPVQTARKIGMTLTSVLCSADWDDISAQYGREGTGARQAVEKVWRDLGGDSALRERMHLVLDELEAGGNGRASASPPDSKRTKRSERAVAPPDRPTPEADTGSGGTLIAHLSPAGSAAVKQLAQTALANFSAAYTAVLEGDSNVTPDQVSGHVEVLMVLLRGSRGMSPAQEATTPAQDEATRRGRKAK